MEPLKTPVPCFGCGKELPPVWAEADVDYKNQPWGAVTFTTYGNYGSRVFDPASYERSQLVINVCDECLLKNAERVLNSVPARATQPPPLLSRWEPPIIETEENNND